MERGDEAAGGAAQALTWLERGARALNRVTDPYAALLTRIAYDQTRISVVIDPKAAAGLVRNLLTLAARCHAEVELAAAMAFYKSRIPGRDRNLLCKRGGPGKACKEGSFDIKTASRCLAPDVSRSGWKRVDETQPSWSKSGSRLDAVPSMSNRFRRAASERNTEDD